MRPRYLSIEGLACFKEKQEIDFSGLDLFAISGSTGAGKSTLLDAILFALYGEVPRVGKHDLKEMISAGRERVSVRFEFDVGDRRFRIARALRRKGSATVRLEEYDGHDFNKMLADKVGTATREVMRLLGLDVDAFTQAIILPQGEFARFLKADPRKRREMLRTLLRLDVYERMRQAAHEVSTRKKHEVEALEHRLRDDYGDVSEAALADLQRKWKEAGKRLEALREESSAAENRLIGMRERYAKTVELTDYEARLVQLHRAAPMIDDARRELDAARRAMELVSVIDEADRATRNAGRARDDAEHARHASEAAAQEQAERARELAHAEEQAQREIPALRDRIARLDRILGRLPEAKRLETSVVEKRTRIERLIHEIDEAGTRMQRLGAEADGQQTFAETARAELDRIDYDARLDEALDRNREAAARLAEVRTTLRKAEPAQERQRTALDELAGEVDRLKSRVRQHEEARRQAEQESERSEAELHAAQRLHAANHLRESLQPGAACPVCTQLVTDPPAFEPHPDIAAAEAAREDARRTLQRTRDETQKTRIALTHAESDAGAARKALAEADDEVREARADVHRLETAIRAALGTRVPADAEAVDVWFMRQVRTVSAARSSFTETKARLDTAVRELGEIRHAQELKRGELDRMQGERSERSEDLEADEKRLDIVRAEIAEVTQSTDPERERAAAVDRMDGFAFRQQSAAQAASKASSELAARQQAHAERARAAQEAGAEASARGELRDRRISRSHFASVDEVRAAMRDDTEQTRLQTQVTDHETDLHAVGQRIGDLRNDLGADRVSAEQLEDARANALRLQENVEQLVSTREGLGQQVDTMEKRLRKALDLGKRLRAGQSDHRLFSGLATDLRSDKFQAYLLEESFTKLAQGASDRLLTLSGQRYSLEFRDDHILVVDHDNAGETRISDTLSGGETFLTSLSLALEISGQVQEAAGAVQLDSLFIDEGFGTLDPDTLTVVSETIQGLQTTGRVVGIITHIPDLRDEFSQQIQITKQQGYSTVQIRGGR